MSHDSGTDLLSLEVDNAVAIMRFNRPQARNAMNLEMRTALVRTVRSLDEDDDVRVIVLTGTDPAFSAGVDLKESTSRSVRPYERTNPGQALRNCATPVIAAVNGPCVTGALEVALSCTFIVASQRASFADTHARVGLIPGWGMSALLPRAVGLRKAREMTATGNFVLAEEALALGLVNHVVPHDELLPTASRLAADIVSADPRAVAASLALYDRGAGGTTTDALGLEAEAVAGWSTSRERTASLLDASISRGSSVHRS